MEEPKITSGTVPYLSLIHISMCIRDRTRIKSLYAPIVEQMGTACKASCEHGSECFRVTYNPQYREGINKDRLSALRAQYPEIYDEFVDQTELRIFKVVKTAIA